MPRLTGFITDQFGPEDLPNDRFRSALAFWQSVRAPGGIPAISAIDITKIPRILIKNLAVADVDDGPRMFRVRLIGDGIVRAMGENKTGRFLDDVPGSEQVLARHRLCVEKRTPQYAEGPVTWSANDFRSFKALGLPFSGPDDQVRRILTYLEFF